MAYVVIAKWRVNDGEEKAVAASLSELTRLSRIEPGNLIYQCHRDPEDPRVFVMYEQYTDEEAFKAHVASPHFEQLVLGDAIPRLESRERAFYITWEGA